MADDTDFEITITTVADTAGAEEAKTAMEELGDAAHSTGERVGEADKSWEQLNEENARLGEEGGVGLKEVSSSAQEAGHAAEGAHGSMRGMRHVISAISKESPIMGHLLRAAMHPATLGFVAFLEVIHIVHKSIEELNKTLESLDAAAVKPLTGSIESQKKAVAESEQSFRDFETQLKHAAEAEDQIHKKADEATDAVRRQARAQTELSSAAEALALAQVDAAEKSGKISEEAAIKERLAIQLRFAEERKNIQKKEATDILGIKEDEIDKLKAAIAKGEAELTSAEAAARKAAVRAAPAPERLKQMEEAYAEQKKKVDELLTRYEGAPETAETIGQKIGGQYREALRPQLEQATAIRDQMRQTLESEQKRKEIVDAASKAAEEHLKHIENQVLANQKLLTAAQEALPIERQKTAELLKQLDAVEKIKAATLGVRAGAAVAVEAKKEEKTELTEARRGLAEVEKAEAASHKAGALERGIKGLAGAGISDQVLDHLTNVVLHGHETLAQAHARLRKQVADLEHELQTVNQRNSIGKNTSN